MCFLPESRSRAGLPFRDEEMHCLAPAVKHVVIPERHTLAHLGVSSKSQEHSNITYNVWQAPSTIDCPQRSSRRWGWTDCGLDRLSGGLAECPGAASRHIAGRSSGPIVQDRGRR